MRGGVVIVWGVKKYLLIDNYYSHCLFTSECMIICCWIHHDNKLAVLDLACQEM